VFLSIFKLANPIGIKKQSYMNEEKILTLHPKGKTGVNILKRRYDVIRNFIVETLIEHNEISFKDLTELAFSGLSNNFDGSVGWYIVTVKLDLEARGLIRRVPNTSPHRLRLTNKS
jgi:hypothetical protein